MTVWFSLEKCKLKKNKGILYNWQPWTYVTLWNIAAAAVVKKLHGDCAPYRGKPVDGQQGTDSSGLLKAPVDSSSFSTEACCRNCSKRSWFCLFHFVLKQKSDCK